VPIVQVNVPVISVGNLTTGGTGKTPLVQWIVRHLQENGRKPAVILRGYKRASRGLLVVHDGEVVRDGELARDGESARDGEKLIPTVREAGDEAYFHAKALNVPVVVCSYKVDAAVHAAGFLPCDVIVVDDGFQHRSLHRDIDVVIVDETPAAKLQLLPLGVLREPVENLARADVVVRLAMHPAGTYGLDGSAVSPLGRDVLPVTAIANPKRFVDVLPTLTSGLVLEPMLFQDHHWFTQKDITSIVARARAGNAIVMTTEKDAVKLEQYALQFRSADVDVCVLKVRIEILEGEEQLRSLILERVINEDSSVEGIGE